MVGAFPFVFDLFDMFGVVDIRPVSIESSDTASLILMWMEEGRETAIAH